MRQVLPKWSKQTKVIDATELDGHTVEISIKNDHRICDVEGNLVGVVSILAWQVVIGGKRYNNFWMLGERKADEAYRHSSFRTIYLGSIRDQIRRIKNPA